MLKTETGTRSKTRNKVQSFHEASKSASEELLEIEASLCASLPKEEPRPENVCGSGAGEGGKVETERRLESQSEGFTFRVVESRKRGMR